MSSFLHNWQNYRDNNFSIYLFDKSSHLQHILSLISLYSSISHFSEIFNKACLIFAYLQVTLHLYILLDSDKGFGVIDLSWPLHYHDPDQGQLCKGRSCCSNKTCNSITSPCIYKSMYAVQVIVDYKCFSNVECRIFEFTRIMGA